MATGKTLSAKARAWRRCYPKSTPRTVRIALLMVMLVAMLPQVALSQERGEVQADYLRTVGLDQEALQLEAFLLEGLQIRKPFLDTARQKGIARYFAFVMTVSGLNAEKAERLEAEGVDFIHAITADTRPLSEQSLLADLVVVGDIIDVVETQEPGDGFRSSLVIEVQTLLQGETLTDTLFIRQRSGLSTDEADEQASRDLRPEIGERYLFLLSNGMYRFFVATQDDEPPPIPERLQARHFVIYRHYLMYKDRLLWNGFSRRDTRRAFKELRNLDQVLADS